MGKEVTLFVSGAKDSLSEIWKRKEEKKYLSFGISDQRFLEQHDVARKKKRKVASVIRRSTHFSFPRMCPCCVVGGGDRNQISVFRGAKRWRRLWGRGRVL